jgi:hypothetical protein
VTFLCLWFWSWVALLCFSFFFLSFSEFHFAVCVVNALIKGEIEDQERPGGRWMAAPQWWVIDNGCRLRPSSCCCRWRTGAKGLQPWGASGRWRDK